MSYGIDLSFKNCKKNETYEKIEEFENLLLKNADEYIALNLCYCKYDTDKDRWENNRLIDDFISRLFKHHIWYCEEIQSLCIVWGTEIKEINEWFDGYVYFQNSCDNDYEYKEWIFNKKFKQIIKWVKSLNEKEFKKEDLKQNEWYEESEIKFDEYEKKTLVYEKCYEMISPIWEKGFSISFLDGVLDENKFDLRRKCIKLLCKKDIKLNKIYYGKE